MTLAMAILPVPSLVVSICSFSVTISIKVFSNLMMESAAAVGVSSPTLTRYAAMMDPDSNVDTTQSVSNGVDGLVKAFVDVVVKAFNN